MSTLTPTRPLPVVAAPVTRHRRTLWAWAKLLVGAAILGGLIWRLGARSVLDGLRAIDAGTVVAALVIGCATTVLCAWRWRIVASRLGLRLPLGQAVADYYRAVFLNNVLPAGVLGDVHRAVEHGRQSGDVGRGVRAVALERLAGQVVVVAAAVAVLLTGPQLGAARGFLLIVLNGVAVLAVAAVLAWRRVRGAPRWRRTVHDVRVGLLARDTWPAVGALSVAALAGNVALFLIAAHATGTTASIGRLIPLLVLALLAMGLPVNIGGWGPREGVTALMFGAAGLGSTQGLTTAVVYGVLAFVAALPGAWLLVAGKRRSEQDPA